MPLKKNLKGRQKTCLPFSIYKKSPFNKGLLNFQGEVLFTSRDYELNSTVANRVIEITNEGKIIDRSIPYEEYIEK